jgi:O-antigen/teichoic acid export membrane protein
MHRNIIANIAGRFWSTISNFIFLPLYIHVLGVENYAVIAFTLIVAGMLMVLDLGLSASITREIARRDVSDHEKYRTFRTLEKIYVVVLLVCGGVGLALAQPVAIKFISATTVDRELIALCLKIIAWEAGLQLLFRFYVSAMMGLERQVEANIFNIVWGAARNGLVLLPLLLWPTLPVFFTAQLVATLVVMLVAGWRLGGVMAAWRPAAVPLIDWDAIRRIRGFAAGIFLIAIVALVNTQLDRIVLSRLLDLEYLAYYNVAIAMGTGLIAIASPFQAAIQPRMTAWFSEGRGGDAGALYFRVTTLVAVLVFPVMATIAVNAQMVVMAWTGNADLARNVAPFVPWVLASYSLLAMSSLTYSVALANGYTRFNNVLGLISLCVSIPGYWLAVSHFGAVGAAALFFVIQFSVSTAFHVLVDGRFLGLGVVSTYLRLFLVPAATAVALAFAFARVAAPSDPLRIMMILYLGSSLAAVLAGVALVVTLLFGMRWSFADLGRGHG